MKVGKRRQMLARLAAAASALSVLLALIAKLVGETIVVTHASYMSFATVAIIFAVYLVVDGWADAARKG